MKRLRVLLVVLFAFLSLAVLAQDAPQTQPEEEDAKAEAVETPAAEVPEAAEPGPTDKGKVHVLFIAAFEKDLSKPDTKRKKKRIEEIPESTLLRIQEVLEKEVRKKGFFSEVKILRHGEEPVLEPGQRGWIFGGYFMDFKKGSRGARILVGWGAGKQKVEIMTSLTEIATGEVIHEERVVDRKVGGWYGGSDEKGLKDFAERVVRLLREQLSTKSYPPK